MEMAWLKSSPYEVLWRHDDVSDCVRFRRQISSLLSPIAVFRGSGKRMRSPCTRSRRQLEEPHATCLRRQASFQLSQRQIYSLKGYVITNTCHNACSKVPGLNNREAGWEGARAAAKPLVAIENVLRRTQNGIIACRKLKSRAQCRKFKT